MKQRTGSWTWSVITILAVAVSLVGSFIGSGALGGTPIAEAAGGALSADATPLAPGGGAFSIWSVIHLGLAGYALWQLSPGARRSARQRSLRPWVVASALLNAAWIWSVQLGFLAGSVIVIVALLIVLIRMLRLMEAIAPQGRRHRLSRCTRVSREPAAASSCSISRAAWRERGAERPVNGSGSRRSSSSSTGRPVCPPHRRGSTLRN